MVLISLFNLLIEYSGDQKTFAALGLVEAEVGTE